MSHEDELHRLRERCAAAVEDRADEIISEPAMMAIAVELVRAIRSTPLTEAGAREVHN